MTGICGWIGYPEGGGDNRALAARMSAALGGDGRVAAPALVERGCAITAHTGIVPATAHRSGSLAAAVQGRILWKVPEDQALSSQRGQAAAVAELYRLHGEQLLPRIGGSFAIAVLDLDNASGLLAIDRMGTRTLCYANPRGRLVFGSTAESVAVHPAIGHRLSDQAIFDYLYCHVVPSPRTIFDGVFKLQPAECVVFRGGEITRRFYWQLRYAEGDHAPQAVLEDRFRGLIRDATRRAIDDNSDIGAFLSGGTDSSTVAGILTELRGKPAKTYSIGFAADGFDEMGYARIAARHFGTAPHEYYVTAKDVVDAIPIIAAAYDEPFGNDSAVPTYFCARMAHADGVRVMLAGDGGDEIFGGNARYAKQRVFEAYGDLPAWLRRGVIEPLANHLPAGEHVAALRKLRSYVQQASVPLPDRLESYNFLQRSPLAEILDSDFLARIDPAAPLATLRDTYRRTASNSYIDRMMHLDLTHTLADNDLRKVSRMCDVAGVEVRYPLLDEALVEFSGELPPSLKVRGLKLRYFFKQALKGFLPPEIIAKTKHGFGMPFGLWLRDRGPLADLVGDSLHSFQRRGIVRPDYIADLTRQHETGHATYFGIMIWVIVMLEQWLGSHRS